MRPTQLLTSPSELYVSLLVLNASSILRNFLRFDSSPLTLPYSLMCIGMCCREGNWWRRASFSHAPMHLKIPIFWSLSALFFRSMFFSQYAEDMMIIHPSFIVTEDQHSQNKPNEGGVVSKVALFPSNIVAIIRGLICLNSGM